MLFVSAPALAAAGFTTPGAAIRDTLSLRGREGLALEAVGFTDRADLAELLQSRLTLMPP